MSLNVLVLAEDITHDQHLVCPLVRAAFAALDQSHANVRPCLDPRFRGIAQATDPDRLRQVYRDYGGMVDLFVLAIDRDGEDGRADTLSMLEADAQKAGADLIGVAAHQEIEAWALAGNTAFKPGTFGFHSWAAVRSDRDVKERAFEPFAQTQGVHIGVGGGRKTLGLTASQGYASRVRAKCAEVAAFEARLRDWLRAR